jgi:RNA polymerase primary sigma factor
MSRGKAIELMDGPGERCLVKGGQTSMHILDPVNIYMEAAGSYELLTAEQEKDLARQIQSGIVIDESLQLPEEFEAADDTREWAEETLDTARGALNHMVMANLRLAAKLAKRYSWSSLGYDELLHDGVVGLIKAAKRFDPDKDIKFSTYATWWVRATIGQSIGDTNRLIDIPHKVEMDLTAIRRIQRDDPTKTVSEICRELKLDESIIKAGMAATREAVSYDKPLDADQTDGATIFNFLSDKDEHPVELEYTAADIVRNIHGRLHERYPDEALNMARIIKWRHVDGYSAEEIGTMLNMEKNSVTGVMTKAMKFLRTLGEEAVAKVSERPEEDFGYRELTEEEAFEFELQESMQLAKAS